MLKFSSKDFSTVLANSKQQQKAVLESKLCEMYIVNFVLESGIVLEVETSLQLQKLLQLIMRHC